MNPEHDPAARRFVVRLAEGQGVLNYSNPAPGVLDLEYVVVSPALRGRGIAGRLAEAACEYARASGARVIPTCSYIAWWFRQHPEQQDLLSTERG